MKKQRILIIIPAFNEEGNIKNVVEKIKKYNYDYVVINDGSYDNTVKILKENNYNYIDLINNLGIGGAMQTGYKYALKHNYDIAVQYDGDGQHNVEYIEKICKPIIEGKANFVIGSRFTKEIADNFKSTRARRMGINVISYFMKCKTKTKIYDTTSGFRAVDKNIIKEFSNDYPIEYPEPVSTTKLILKGYKVNEIEVKMNERKAGVSSINSWKNVYYMINVILSIVLLKRGDK